MSDQVSEGAQGRQGCRAHQGCLKAYKERQHQPDDKNHESYSDNHPREYALPRSEQALNAVPAWIETPFRFIFPRPYPMDNAAGGAEQPYAKSRPCRFRHAPRTYAPGTRH